MIKEKKFLFIIISLHVFIIILGLLSIIILSGKDYNNILLMDDGYYYFANRFITGGSLFHNPIGPGLPLIYSAIFAFPRFLHPFIRLLISLSFSIGTLIILWHITKDYISGTQFFWGSLLVIFNPIYNHWILKSSPEIDLAFFLGLLILLLLKYYKTGAVKYFIYSIFVFFLSIFLKPIFLLIPFLLLLSTIFTKSKKIFVVSIMFILFSFGGYTIFYKITYKTDAQYVGNIKKRVLPYGSTELIWAAFLTDYIIKTRRLHKGTIVKYKTNPYTKKSDIYNFGGYFYDVYNKTARIWVENFFKKYPDSSVLFMNFYFIYNKPLLVLQKLVVSPILFFSLTSRPAETCIMLTVSFFSLLFSILGIRTRLKIAKLKNEIILICFIIIGFSSLYFISHSIGRYSLPILPYLYVWGGIPISKFRVNKFFALNNRFSRHCSKNQQL
jgi:hypothetical protein